MVHEKGLKDVTKYDSGNIHITLNLHWISVGCFGGILLSSGYDVSSIKIN